MRLELESEKQLDFIQRGQMSTCCTVGSSTGSTVSMAAVFHYWEFSVFFNQMEDPVGSCERGRGGREGTGGGVERICRQIWSTLLLPAEFRGQSQEFSPCRELGEKSSGLHFVLC